MPKVLKNARIRAAQAVRSSSPLYSGPHTHNTHRRLTTAKVKLRLQASGRSRFSRLRAAPAAPACEEQLTRHECACQPANHTRFSTVQQQPRSHCMCMWAARPGRRARAFSAHDGPGAVCIVGISSWPHFGRPSRIRGRLRGRKQRAHSGPATSMLRWGGHPRSPPCRCCTYPGQACRPAVGRASVGLPPPKRGMPRHFGQAGTVLLSCARGRPIHARPSKG